MRLTVAEKALAPVAFERDAHHGRAGEFDLEPLAAAQGPLRPLFANPREERKVIRRIARHQPVRGERRERFRQGALLASPARC